MPDDLKNEPTLATLPREVPAIIKKLINAQKMTGKNKVALPGEKATEAELDEFYDAIGRPKTIQDYGEYPKDPELPAELYDSDRINRGLELMHKLGLTKKQAAALMAWDNEELKAADTAALEADDQKTLDTEKILKEELGMAYEETIHANNVFINQFTEEGEERDAIIKEFGRNPLFIKWIGRRIAPKFLEHKTLIADLTQATPREAQAKIAELQSTPGFMDGTLKQKDPVKHQRMQSELEELYQQAYPKQAG